MQELSQIVIRLDPDDKALIAKVASDRREDISSFVRRAIMVELAKLSYLTEEEKKSLGLPASVRKGKAARGAAK